MNLFLEYKFLTIIAAVVLMLISYYPYIRDILAKKTKPHIYTWIIWFITQGTAAMGVFYGGSIYSGLGLLSGAAMVSIIILLSLKYGTKNITKTDTITLLLALSAVFVWWQMQNPLLAVVMVSLIDTVGYFPSFRKTWQEPKTETPSFWFLISVSTLLTLLANTEYSLLTSLYLVLMFISNFAMFSISHFRRKFV